MHLDFGMDKNIPPTRPPSRSASAVDLPRKGGGEEREARGIFVRTFRSLNSTSVGRNPASVLPPPVGAINSTERPAFAFSSKSS